MAVVALPHGSDADHGVVSFQTNSETHDGRPTGEARPFLPSEDHPINNRPGYVEYVPHKIHGSKLAPAREPPLEGEGLHSLLSKIGKLIILESMKSIKTHV